MELFNDQKNFREKQSNISNPIVLVTEISTQNILLLRKANKFKMESTA